MLFPLAAAFGISVDSLMGYDETKLRQQITQILERYRKLNLEGDFLKAGEVIERAREEYPQDYRIMDAYMSYKAGSNGEGLLKHKEELSSLCESILSGCDQETIRLNAVNMQAKLLNAQGKTEQALAVLSQLPGWGNSREQRKEQLYEKGTAQFCYWNRKNCYALMDAMANKLMRTVWYDDISPLGEKVATLEAMADSLFALRGQKGMTCFCIAAHMVYAELSGRLSDCGEVRDVIRIREKQFSAIRAVMELEKKDEALSDCLMQTYGTTDLLSWQIDWLLHAQHTQFVKLRERPEYMALLEKYGKISN